MKINNLRALRSAAMAPEVSRLNGAPIVVMSEAGRFQSVGPSPSLEARDYNCGPDPNDNRMCEAMVSSCGDSEGRTGETVCPSQLPASGCSDVLHELANLMTGVLLKAQMLEWKLPPYSHLKRPVREVARNAQRSSELMKALLRRCGESGWPGQAPFLSANAESPSVPDDTDPALAMPAAAATRGPRAPCHTGLDLTAGCDTCTSGAFPKRDDRDGR